MWKIKEINNYIVIYLNIDKELALKRTLGRVTCDKCGRSYNIFFDDFKPKVEGICDKCGGELYQREDQKPEVVENRLQVYSKTAEELINHYKKANILYDAKAGDKVGKTSYDVAKEVEEYIKNN